MAEVKLSMEEYHNVVKALKTLTERLYETTKECTDYKKQRDELINDMADIKRKAEAFDEILNVDYIVAPDDYAHEITKIVDKYREEQ
ncbi:hypothetical protein [Staphylococcus haemolyticus]|uniref:hypothetical protein n=1 Tax=Staphylococcus haemolyticus TaxID=1283 RepID=UPI000450CD5E|nr:hypothetical protein [Staphylococcus haemolyticus]EZI40303.1 hypothetical protein BW32_00088 [Staphylococcus haemolyticus]